jgi:pSer/pThr/pTyr-binding forkhead associated (FHA) protein
MSEEVILKIIEGNLAGEEFVFDEKGLCLIGRSADCALQIPKEKDMRISRRHCLLILDPPHVRVRDLGSRNGTTVNDEYLDSGAISEEPEKMTPVDKILKDGDIISIGETVLKVEVPSERPIDLKNISQTTPKKTPPATKVIKLSKPSPTKTGTIIPKSTPVSGGFFAPPKPAINTASRTIAMTEAIPREKMVHKHPSVDPKKGSGSIASGPLTPPPKAKIVSASPAKTVLGPTGAGPLAPPPPKKAPILLGKKKESHAEPSDTVAKELPKATIVTKSPVAPSSQSTPTKTAQEPAVDEVVEKKPVVLKAKIVSPGSTGAKKIPKKLNSHMKTVVMDAEEFDNIDDLVEQPLEESVASKPKKRVTKFKIKGPN